MASSDGPARDLALEIGRIPFVDCLSAIEPSAPFAQSLEDLLGHGTLAELGRSLGMQADLDKTTTPRERVRIFLAHVEGLENTHAYAGFVEFARFFLGFQGDRITVKEADALWNVADKAMNHTQWAGHVWKKTHAEKIVVPRTFDALGDMGEARFVPALRLDELVFELDQSAVRERLAKMTGVEATDAGMLHQALTTVFQQFTQRQGKACALRVPASFAPAPVTTEQLSRGLMALTRGDREPRLDVARGALWLAAEYCQAFGVPLILLLGDLGPAAYLELFRTFPRLAFLVSISESAHLQELIRVGRTQANVHLLPSRAEAELPALARHEGTVRLQGVAQAKLLFCFSEGRKVEFVLPKIEAQRRVLAKVLVEEYVRPGLCTEQRALEWARQLLRENAVRLFKL